MDNEQVSGDREFAEGTVIAGRLRILRRLGMGGMGAVYEVEHEITRHRRALKLLHAQMAQVPSVVERFLREASAAGRIGNPHIVETFDAGRLESGEPYIVMELLQGQTLAELLSEKGPLDVDVTTEVLLQACDATAAAHATGIVHRDLKPENLFLCGPKRDFVKVLDFGISKFDSTATGVEVLTLEGSPLGTPYYMSPEQVQGEKTLDGRTDVYALGVLLYECLTGQKPFVADTLPHLVVLIFQGNYVPASQLRPQLPRVLDDIIAKAMARDRNDRFATAQEFASALTGLRSADKRLAAGNSTSGLLVEHDLEARPLPPRATPALTPDVFSRPTRLVEKPARPARIRIWAAIGAIAACAISAGLAYRLIVPSRSQRIDLFPVNFAATPLAPAPDAGERVVPQASATSALANGSTRDPQDADAQHATAAPSLTHPKALRPPDKSSTAAPPSTQPQGKNRASSYGLTERNPFN